jgi:predicted transglutaminase-like cysteine proteinase
MSIPPIWMRRPISHFSQFFAFCAAIACIYSAQALDIGKLHAVFLSLTGNTSEQRFTAWVDLQTKSQSLSDNAKLAKVNDFVNQRIHFADDQKAWGKSDYWATPMETLAKGDGDCEDFAIIKYYTLTAIGIPVDQLRLTYVRARIGGASSSMVQAHMVLTYYASPDAEPLVLDNLVSSIYPASRRPDLQPVFSFNSQHIFQANQVNTSPSAATASTSRLSRWQDLLVRASSEGFDQ